MGLFLHQHSSSQRELSYPQEGKYWQMGTTLTPGPWEYWVCARGKGGTRKICDSPLLPLLIPLLPSFIHLHIVIKATLLTGILLLNPPQLFIWCYTNTNK